MEYLKYYPKDTAENNKVIFFMLTKLNLKLSEGMSDAVDKLHAESRRKIDKLGIINFRDSAYKLLEDIQKGVLSIDSLTYTTFELSTIASCEILTLFFAAYGQINEEKFKDESLELQKLFNSYAERGGNIEFVRTYLTKNEKITSSKKDGDIKLSTILNYIPSPHTALLTLAKSLVNKKWQSKTKEGDLVDVIIDRVKALDPKLVEEVAKDRQRFLIASEQSSPYMPLKEEEMEDLEETLEYRALDRLINISKVFQYNMDEEWQNQ